MDENEIPQNKDIVYFARTNFRNTNNIFGIKRKDRRQHTYVLGKSGTGKSVLLSNMIIQDIRNGDGVCVVDPHGELVEEILHMIPDERANDVIYLNPADPDYHIGFNVMQLEDPKYKHLVASGLMGIFTKIWANAWSSRMEYILNNTILALLDTPNTTMLGIQRMLVDKDYRQMIISNLKDPVVKAFWVHEYEQWRDQFRNEAIAPIQNKVGQFLSTSIIRNVVGQQKSTIDIFKIMNEGKIFLVNVSKGRIGEDNSALLGGMIITKIQLATMERVRIPENERKDFYLYVDEFQNFATDSFANILSEARKYRLNLTVAHQYTAQLENKDNGQVRDAVFGNVGTMIVFRVGADDADFLEKEFEPEFTAQDLVNLPNYHIYLKLMIDGVTSRPFSAATLPPLKPDVSSGVHEKIIEISRNNYTRKREEVEEEIEKWSGTLQTADGEEKYKADCSNCKKPTMVPFEPQEGRPVYCRDCLAKIKSGQLKPETGFTISRSSTTEPEIESAGPLAELGIEFTEDKNKPNVFHNKHNIESLNEDESELLKGKNISSGRKKISKQRKINKKSKPSPLLKGLLRKIGATNENPEKILKKSEEVKELKKETPQPISLSSLDSDNNKKNKNIPTKEASEEKKASLKDLLGKIGESKEIEEEKEKSEIIQEKNNENKVIGELKKSKSSNEEYNNQKAELKSEQEPVELVSEVKPEPKPDKIEETVAEKISETERKDENVKEEKTKLEDNSNKKEIKKEEIDLDLDEIHKNSDYGNDEDISIFDEKHKPDEDVVDIDNLKEEDKQNQDQENKEENLDDVESWQKHRAGKEVPEDVLRKVLE